MPQIKTVRNVGDVVSVGQLARQWERPLGFVRRLVKDGLLETNEDGLITNPSLAAYYREHGSPA